MENKITQCRTSYSIRFFEQSFCSKWGLQPLYQKSTEPCIFFGAYNQGDYVVIQNHKSLAVVVWAGSDSMAKPELLATLNKPNIKHISGSKWITDDLKKAGIESIYLPISCVDSDKSHIKPIPLGNKIYIYSTVGDRGDFYGRQLYDKLIEKYGRQLFYLCHAKSYSKADLYGKILPDCFLGLRLVEHDGLSETVSELGLMGRRVIYNGCEPNALNYKSLEDIIDHIENERKYIGQTFPEVSEKMKKHLDVGTDWLTSKFYEK